MFTQNRAVENFASHAAALGNTAMALVAAATVAFVARQDDSTLGELSAALHEAVEERGLKTAQVFRYVGLAKALAGEGGVDEAIAEKIRVARSPGVATEALLRWLHAEGLVSLDKLAERLGTYQRTPAAAKSTASTGTTAARVVTPGAVSDRRHARLPHEHAGGREESAGGEAALTAAPNPVEALRAIAVEIDDADLLADMIDVLEERLIAVQLEARRSSRHAIDTRPKPPSRGRRGLDTEQRSRVEAH